MMKCKVLSSITTRKDGVRKTYEKGSIIYLEDKEVSRLIKESVVEVIDAIENNNADLQIDYLDEKELKKLNKDELVEYGGKIGIELTKEMKNQELMNAILDYIGEKESLGE